MAGNKKIIQLTVKRTKSFNLILASFDFVSTLFATIKLNKIKLVATLLLKLNQTQIIKLNKIKMLVSQLKLGIGLSKTIIINKIKMSSIVSLFVPAVSIIQIKKLQIIATVINLIDISSSVNLKIVKIVTSFLAFQAYPLSVYDPQTLSSLDSRSLGNMDYLIV